MKRIVLALAWLLFAGVANAQMAVGINLAAPSDWGRAWIWKDQMRQARWLAGNNWWLVQWNHQYYPPGRWVAEWTGVDSPKFVRGVGTIDEILPGLATLDINPVKGIAVQPFGDVQDIRLWMPGVNRSGSPFHPEYVKSLTGFKVLRFMDWQATNSSTLVEWTDRRFMEEHQQWEFKDTRGVALEYCLELANEVGADPWLCTPHLASDDFLLQMAKLIDQHLPAGSVCYLEPSNEYWNSARGFSGGQWFAAEAQRMGIPLPAVYGGQLKRIASIVRPVLGDRVRIVLAGQANNVWQAKKSAEFAGRGNFDAVSCAWYFGVAKGFVGTVDHTVSDVLDQCEADINGRLVKVLAEHKAIADAYGVPLVCYEGGQHLVATATSPVADEFLAAQRHPRMGDRYRLALQRCREAGVTLAIAFNDVSPWSSAGSWGAREHMTDYTSPKWAALVAEAAK